MSSQEVQNRLFIQEKRTIISLSFIFFLKMFGLFILFPIFTALSQYVTNATPFLLGLAMGAYGISGAIFQVPFGLWCDRFGDKKLLLIGLAILMVGSLLGCFATNIYTLIIARFLQGCGVTSTPILSIVAKSTRSEVRMKSYSVFGGAIAFSFILAFISSPLLLPILSLHGLFILITVLTCLAFIIALRISTVKQTNKTTSYSIRLLLKQKTIVLLGFISCSLSIGLASVFFSLPYVLTRQNIAQVHWWKYYLPLLLGGLVLSLPLLFLATAKKKFSLVMIIGLVMAFLVFILEGIHSDFNFTFHILLYTFFFTSFILFEPILPSLTSLLCPPEMKGTASGVYTLFKFIGMFLGASLSGMFFQIGYFNIFQIAISLLYLVLLLLLIKNTHFFRLKTNY